MENGKWRIENGNSLAGQAKMKTAPVLNPLLSNPSVHGLENTIGWWAIMPAPS
jgi:hypothetical protein